MNDRPSLSLHIPAPATRPGDVPGFGELHLSPAGAVRRPEPGTSEREIRDLPFALIRVLDDDGAALGPWAPRLPVATLLCGLRAMLLTRVFDDRLFRAHRQGKTSFYMADAARANRLNPAEMGGGTITLTSLGPLGGVVTTPVINRPEVAIIGPNRIVERPVFDGDDLRRAKLMNNSISCDHRVVDGWKAASYVQNLKRLLETPVLLFAPDRSTLRSST